VTALQKLIEGMKVVLVEFRITVHVIREQLKLALFQSPYEVANKYISSLCKAD
jgi:hypothetical protein